MTVVHPVGRCTCLSAHDDRAHVIVWLGPHRLYGYDPDTLRAHAARCVEAAEVLERHQPSEQGVLL